MQILNFILSIIEDTASSIFSNFILKRIRKNKKDNKEECKKSVDEKKYKTDFAKRIDQLMFLINQEKYYGFEELNLSKLAEYLNLESVEILKQYYKESREPTFQFIDSVAEKLGVNHNWLKMERASPFYQRIIICRNIIIFQEMTDLYLRLGILKIKNLFLLNII